MLLLKLHAAAGAARAEVLQLAQVFRARIVDVSDETVTLVVSGDPGKLAALLKVMAKFGVVELARTGRVALKRGDHLLADSEYLPEGGSVASGSSPEEEASSRWGRGGGGGVPLPARGWSGKHS